MKHTTDTIGPRNLPLDTDNHYLHFTPTLLSNMSFQIMRRRYFT